MIMKISVEGAPVSGSTDEPLGSTFNALLKGSLKPLTGSETPGVSGYLSCPARGPKTPGRGQQQGYSTRGVNP